MKYPYTLPELISAINELIRRYDMGEERRDRTQCPLCALTGHDYAKDGDKSACFKCPNTAFYTNPNPYPDDYEYVHCMKRESIRNSDLSLAYWQQAKLYITADINGDIRKYFNRRCNIRPKVLKRLQFIDKHVMHKNSHKPQK